VVVVTGVVVVVVDVAVVVLAGVGVEVADAPLVDGVVVVDCA
jgi:hypothetical protein